MPFQRWCGSPRLTAKARSLIARGPNTWVCRLKRFLALIGREQFTRMTLIATLRRGECRSLAANRWSKRSGTAGLMGSIGGFCLVRCPSVTSAEKLSNDMALPPTSRIASAPKRLNADATASCVS